MKTVDFVRDKWPAILDFYKMPPVTGSKHYQESCPICGKVGKLRIDNRDGTGSYICTCSNGTGFDLLMRVTGRTFQDLCNEIDRKFGNSQEKAEREIRTDETERVGNRFKNLIPLVKSDAVEYLHSRSLFNIPRRHIRYSPAEYDHDAKRSIPCIYAIATNDLGEPVYRHLTYIENGKKADVPVQKKMYAIKSYSGSVAVRFSDAGAVLGIAEGIETALSAQMIYRIPTWSTLNAGLMERFIAPLGVEDLYIFADNDVSGTGLQAAFRCARSNLLSKNDVKNCIIRWPAVQNDFNDLLTIGDEVCEWILGDKHAKENKNA